MTFFANMISKNVFDIIDYFFSDLDCGWNFMAMSLLIMSLLIRDLTRNPEIEKTSFCFCPISGDWGELKYQI